jgi:protein phosphatase
MRLRWAAVTDVGRVRPHNEDEILAEEPLFAVADGMGGHAAGEVASQVAIQALRASFAQDPSADGLAKAVKDANAAVWNRAEEQPETRGMGTTMTAAALVGDDEGAEQVIEVANVGDSRAYLLRDGELEQLSHDHSLVEDLVQSGRLTPEEAIDHPQRHIVTRALGVIEPDELEVDTFTVIPFKGDRVLLASDGLSDMVSHDKIASVLRRFADPTDAADELVRVAKEAGGNDNISVVVVDVVDDDDKAGGASKALANEPPPPPGGSGTATITEREPEEPTTLTAATPERRRRRARAPRQKLTLRTIGFIVAVVAVLVLAVAAITWYARGSYFVGVRSGNVTIFRGRPGGFLWVKPTVVDRTELKLADVPPARQSHLREGQPETTLRAARHYIDNLRNEAEQLSLTTTTTTAPPPPPTSTP